MVTTDWRVEGWEESWRFRALLHIEYEVEDARRGHEGVTKECRWKMPSCEGSFENGSGKGFSASGNKY